jgi:ribosome-binding protein aMBF1 (putative translation factor)
MSLLSGQDWTPTVLKKTLTKEEHVKRGNTVAQVKIGAGTNKASAGVPANARALDSEDVPKPLLYGSELGKDLARIRQAILLADGEKKFRTQELLAKAAGVSTATIKAYEDGKAIYRADEVNKIQRALGKDADGKPIALGRPQKPKKISS